MHTPDFNFPALFARLGPRLPQRPWSDALTLALEVARRSGKLAGDLDFLSGRTVAIHVSDLGATACVGYRDGRFHSTRESADAPADVRFSARACDYLRVLRREEDPDTLFFQRKLRIEGDTELGLTLKNLLDSIEIPDWLLSRPA